jgi:hypothetical protein
MSAASFVKDPQAQLDYLIDWAAWLGADTIATSTWVSSDPTVLVVEIETNTPTTATVWLSGGVDRERYTVTNTITTVGGRTDERTISVRIKQK